MDRRKGFAFHPEDWLSDTRLALCSYATKGAWIDILCHMFQSHRAGYLMVDGKSLKKEDVQCMLKCRTQEEFETIWNELLNNGVMKQHADGTYYSKRMVQDAERISMNWTATKEDTEFAQQVLEEFKRVCVTARAYNGDEARAMVLARKREEKASLDDFKAVIALKYNDWKDQENMKPAIRPATFFGEKFKGYMAESKGRRMISDSAKASVPRSDYSDM